jgi:hypothetical protein
MLDDKREELHAVYESHDLLLHNNLLFDLSEAFILCGVLGLDTGIDDVLLEG